MSLRQSMNLGTPFEKSAPIGSQLIASLRRRIVSGELRPGTRLSEKDIGVHYGLSRQPVREAFIKLAADQLVEVWPQRGTYVRKIDIQEVLVSRFVREAVEADVVRLAAEHADRGSVRMLSELVNEQDRLSAEGGADFMQLDDDFHRAIAEMSGHSGAWDHLQSIKMHMDRVRHLTSIELPVAHLAQQHRAIADAIAMGDPDKAEHAMRSHLRGVLEDLPKMRKSMPDFFT